MNIQECRHPLTGQCGQFQATGQPESWTQASDAMRSRLPRYEAKCVQRRCFQWGSVPLHSNIKGTELPPANILILLERQLTALQLSRWQLLYNETLQQTFRPLLLKLSKRREIYVIYPHFEEGRGGVEPRLTARWKDHVDFLLTVIEYLFLSFDTKFSFYIVFSTAINHDTKSLNSHLYVTSQYQHPVNQSLQRCTNAICGWKDTSSLSGIKACACHYSVI